MKSNPALLLRRALAANALFSLTSGLALLFYHDLIASWLGITEARPLWIIGLLLTIFATELIFQTLRARIQTWRVLLVTASDLLWVVGSVVLLLFFAPLFTTVGLATIAGVALAVLALAFGQWWGIDRYHRIGSTGYYRHCLRISTNAPATDLWKIIGDLGEIRRFLPMLKSSALREGGRPGVGAIRECEDWQGRRWAESCTEFIPGKLLTLRFLTQEKDFPFPAREMFGGWEIIPLTDEQSIVKIWWEIEPHRTFTAPLLMGLLVFASERTFPVAVQRMTLAAKGEAFEITQTSLPPRRVRLLTGPC